MWQNIFEFFAKHWVVIITLLGLNFLTLKWREKDLLAKDIKSLIKACQESGAWTEKSEYKLDSWLENIRVEDLHRQSIFKLLRIKQNMSKYLDIHIKEWYEEEFGSDDADI